MIFLVHSWNNLKPRVFPFSVDPCWNGGHCIDGLGSYSCYCVSGFAGKNCQYGINECASDPCMNGATCLDFVNAYTCKCLPGFSGVNCQNNDDDCTARFCNICFFLLCMTVLLHFRRQHLWILLTVIWLVRWNLILMGLTGLHCNQTQLTLIY